MGSTVVRNIQKNYFKDVTDKDKFLSIDSVLRFYSADKVNYLPVIYCGSGSIEVRSALIFLY